MVIVSVATCLFHLGPNRCFFVVAHVLGQSKFYYLGDLGISGLM